MGREERKLRKHYEERAKRERRLARKYQHSTSESESDQGTAGNEGLVIGIAPGTAIVEDQGATRHCRTTFDVAVGDRVLYSLDRLKVIRLLPRRTVLSRPDPHNPRIERVIAANIDIIVIVVSIKSPPLRPGLIDRYLVAIERSGADPLICVNKTDLGESAELDLYRNIGVPIIMCSAATGAGIDELAAHLANKTCVFSGHSGVGKSSLLNRLSPEIAAATSAVSAVHNKGRHTTTSASLHRLPNGSTIIDTPGIREFGLWNVTPSDLAGYFPEIRNLASQCTFRNCSHTHEPVCAVKDGISSGAVASHRYAAYLRILECVKGESQIY